MGALYLLLGFGGYGSDGDTYGMLRSGLDALTGKGYSPSRMPGFPLPELAVGAAGSLGGPVLANAISALLGCVALACFHFLLRRPFGARIALCATAAAGLNPHWVIAASSSIDYVYAAAFFLSGLVALRARRPFVAAALFALCAASRLTYAPLALLAFAVAILTDSASPRKRDLQAGAVFAGMTVLAYLPGWFAAGGAMFRVTVGDARVPFFALTGFDSWWAYAGRFAYKNVYLWGLPGFLIVSLAAIAAIRRFRRAPRPRGAWIIAAGFAAAMLYLQALFLRLPLEVSYLLPVLFLGLALACLSPRAPLLLGLLLLSHGVEGIRSFDLIRVEYASHSFDAVHASGARFSPGFRPGPIIVDRKARPAAQRHHWRQLEPDYPWPGPNARIVPAPR